MKTSFLSSEPVDSNGLLSLLVVNVVVVPWLISVQIPNTAPDSSEPAIQIKSIRHLSMWIVRLFSGFLSHLCLKIPIHFPRIVQRLKQPCKMDQLKEWQNWHQLEDTCGTVRKIPSKMVECIAGKIDYRALLENISSKTLE